MMPHSRNKDPDKSNTPLLHDQLHSPDCDAEQPWKGQDSSAGSKKKSYNSTSSPSKGTLSSSKWNEDDWGDSEDWGQEQKAVANSPLKMSSKTKPSSTSQGKQPEPQMPHSRPKSSSKGKKDKEGEQLLIDFGDETEVTKQTWSGWDEWGQEETNPKKGYQRIDSKNY